MNIYLKIRIEILTISIISMLVSSYFVRRQPDPDAGSFSYLVMVLSFFGISTSGLFFIIGWL